MSCDLGDLDNGGPSTAVEFTGEGHSGSKITNEFNEAEDEQSILSKYSADAVDDGDAGLGDHGSPASRTSSGGSENIVCRICQSSGSESGAELQTTGCACKGYLSYVHERCLRCWVQTQRSLKCEVCHESYQLVSDEQLNRQRAPRTVAAFGLSEQMATTPALVRVCIDPRRGCFGVVVLMLAMTTISAASLMGHMESAYKDAWQRHVLDPQSNDIYADARRLQICFQMVLTVLVVLSIMCIGILFMWILAELYFWPGQRIQEFNWRALVGQSNGGQRTIIY